MNIRLSYPLCLLIVFFVGACKIPRYSVVFTNVDALGTDQHLDTIPEAWNGRLLRFKDNPKYEQLVTMGGDPLHHHNIYQVHTIESGPTKEIVNPLGINSPASSPNHVHAINSISQNPETSSDELYDPYHQELLTYVVRKNMKKVPMGLIVAYIGNDLPKNWEACDGRNGTPNLDCVFISLKRSEPVSAASGSNNHQHNIKHQHAWSVSSPALDRPLGEALAGDEIPHSNDTIHVNSFVHSHNANSIWKGSELTKPQPVSPPSVKVRFIRSKNGVKRMPKGAILPYLGGSAPSGWKILALDTNARGRFLFASLQAKGLSETFGSLTHSHTYMENQTLALTPRAVTTTVINVSHEDNLPVSLVGHTHSATIDSTFKTGSSSALPKWIAFSFIIKK